MTLYGLWWIDLEKLAQLYIQEIVSLYGIPSTIVSDRDPRFTSQFWGASQKAFGTRLCLSTTHHPQRMVKQSGLFKLWKICCERISWSSEETRIDTYH